MKLHIISTVTALAATLTLAQAFTELSIHPGNGVTTNVTEQITGQVNLTVNPGASGGGVVRLNPDNSYYGRTILGCGTLLIDKFADGGAFSSIGASGSDTNNFVIGAGTIRYIGSDNAVANRGLRATGQSMVFDLTNNLTLTGAVNVDNGCFFKTGPGTLFLGYPGTNLIPAASSPIRQENITDIKANGDAPIDSLASISVLEGTLAWGVPGQTVLIRGTDTHVGGYTSNDAGGEKPGFIDIYGGYTYFNCWLAIGRHNGNLVTAPTPTESRVRVFGGTVDVDHLTVGRNKKGYSSYKLHSRPTLEIHGGTMNIKSTCSLGVDQGGDTVVRVLGGTFNTTVLCQFGAVAGQSTNLLIIANGGLFKATAGINAGLVNAKTDTTIDVYNGGILNSANILATTGTHRMRFDGGILRPIYISSQASIAASISQVQLSTNGVSIELSGNNTTLTLASPSVNAPDLNGAEDGGITISGTATANINMAANNSYKGPTKLNNGRLIVNGTLPITTSLALNTGTSFAVTNNSKTVSVKELNLGSDARIGSIDLFVAVGNGTSATLTATDSFAITANTTLKLNFVSAGTFDAVALNGSFTFLKVPANDAVKLAVERILVANPVSGKDYTIRLDVENDTAIYSVDVTDGTVSGDVWVEPQGGIWSDGDNWSANTPPNAPFASATFTTEAQSGGAEVTLNTPVTLGSLTLASSEPYTFVGNKLTLNSGSGESTWNTTLGTHTLDAPLALQGPLALNTLEGATQIVTQAISGGGPLRVNTAPAGGGTVKLQGALNLAAGLTTGSGTTIISAEPTGPVVLGPGTLKIDYQEPNDFKGFLIAAGSSRTASLECDNDVTITSDIQTESGSFIKKGSGTLTLAGSAAFNFTGSYSGFTHNFTGYPLNGDSPTNGFGSLTVAAGKLVFDESAQEVTTASSLYIGVPNSNLPGGATTGEVEINGGTNTIGGNTYIGVMNGDPISAPVPMRPRLTVNGGDTTINGELRMGWDVRTTTAAYYNTQAAQNTQPELIMNGGILRLTGGFYPCYHGGAAPTNTIVMNGGEFYAKFMYFGAARFGTVNAAPTYLTMNGGYMELKEDLRTARFGADTYFRFNGGTLRAWDIQKADGPGDSQVWLNGGVFQPVYTGQSAVYCTFDRHTNVWVGAGGFIIDTTYWPPTPDAPPYEIKQNMDHDPDLGDTLDGGIIKRGRGTGIIIRPDVRYAFTGPVTVEEGILGIDRAALASNDVIMHEDTSIRLSNKNDPTIINSLVAGTNQTGSGSVILDLTFEANTAKSQPLVVLNDLSIVADIIITGHDDGKFTYALPLSTSTVLVCNASQTLDVAKFKADPLFTGRDVTFSKITLNNGPYSGWQAIIMEVTFVDNMWIQTALGGDWSLSGNWLAGSAPQSLPSVVARFPSAILPDVPVSVDAPVTVGQLSLEGANDNGYNFTGNQITAATTPGGTEIAIILATAGKHKIAAPIQNDQSLWLDTRSGASLELVTALTGSGTLTINPLTSGGGKAIISNGGAINGLTLLQSGTLATDSLAFNGNIELGPGTLHYTGPATASGANITLRPGGSRAAILRHDNDVTLYGTVTSASGAFVKTGTGTLRIAGSGAHKLSSAADSANWNLIKPWPANGDSPVPANSTGFPGLLIDEGTLVIGAEGQTVTIGGECWIGAQNRGWGYTTDSATLNILGGTINFSSTISIGRNFMHTTGQDTYTTVNLYGGVVTCGHIIMCYDLAQKNHSAKAVLNILGGELISNNEFRLGHNYGNANNPAQATVNVYSGTLRHYHNTAAKNGIRMGFLNSSSEGRGANGTLNIYGGQVRERDPVRMGLNNSTSRLNLHGGILQAETILQENEYAAGGSAHLYFNGGTFQPLGSNISFRVMENITSALISTNGFTLDTTYLAEGFYTVGQVLAHDPALGETPDGGMIKRGSAEVVLSGINAFTGPVKVEEGSLRATIDGAIPVELQLANNTVFNANGATRTIPRVAGSGLCSNGVVRVTERIAPRESLTLANLTLASGATHFFGTNNVVKVEGELLAEGTGFVDFGRTEANPIPVPSNVVIMEYDTCNSNFIGWKPQGTGQTKGKVAMRIVRDESGPQKVLCAELLYSGTLFILK